MQCMTRSFFFFLLSVLKDGEARVMVFLFRILCEGGNSFLHFVACLQRMHHLV